MYLQLDITIKLQNDDENGKTFLVALILMFYAKILSLRTTAMYSKMHV
jgi:hypothetical protein